MAEIQNEGAGVFSRVLQSAPVSTCIPDEQYAENIRSAMGRGLPEIGPKHPHEHVMSIAAGGPSLADTWQELHGVTCAVNGSLSFLLEKDVTPWGCGIMDPRPHMAEIIERHPDVFYFVASTCHPALFDKLHGLNVGLWHPLGMGGIEEIAKGAAHFIGGGTTMGLRWFNIGYFLGFREFHAHGLDSSFRDSGTHAYPDHTDGAGHQEMFGYRTRQNFVQQISDWVEMKAMFAGLEDQPRIKLYGDGLLQHCDRNGFC
jgi:hypothetical protein